MIKRLSYFILLFTLCIGNNQIIGQEQKKQNSYSKFRSKIPISQEIEVQEKLNTAKKLFKKNPEGALDLVHVIHKRKDKIYHGMLFGRVIK